MSIQFTVQYDGGTFWLYNAAQDEQTSFDYRVFDILQPRAKWSIAVLNKGKRARRCMSPMTNSISALLDHVIDQLSKDCEAKVFCLTPEIEVCFIC